jgi:iron complex outermembrane receptor protein
MMAKKSKLLLFFLLVVTPAFGQTVFELNPFFVVAPNLAGTERFFGAESVQTSKPIDLAQVLAEKVPGMALARRGPVAGDLVLRGFSRDNIQITVNGNSTYCACPNRMDPPAFHVSSEQIASVVVRRGPFSVDSGGTTGGSVHVRTRSPAGEPSQSVSAFAGNFGYTSFAGSLSTALGAATHLRLGASYEEGDVYKDGDGVPFTRFPGTNFIDGVEDEGAFQITNLEAQFAYTESGGMQITGGYGFQDAVDVLYPGLRMDATKDQMQRGEFSIAWPLKSRAWDQIQFQMNASNVDHEMVDTFRMSSQTNPAFKERGYMMRTLATSAHRSMRMKMNRQRAGHALRFGIDAQERNWDADNTIMQLSNFMIPDVDQTTFGLWGVAEWRRDVLVFELGTRLDHVRSEAQDSIDFLQSLRPDAAAKRDDWLPSLYFMTEWVPKPNLRLFAGLGTATRVADPQELFINLNRPGNRPDWVGNPELEPVRTTELQAGINWNAEGYSITASAFHSWLDHYVYLDELDPSIGRATTYTGIDARLYGFEVEGTVRLSEHIEGILGAAWQEGQKEERPQGATNDVLAEIPPLRGSLALKYAMESFSTTIELRYQDTYDRVDPDLNEQPIDGWTTVNVRLRWKVTETVTFSAGIDNLFDETYAVANSFIRDPFSSGVIVHEPGRFAYVRLQFSR